MTHGPLPLAGKVALVTGGAKRIGRAISLGLAGAGADVVVHYRSSGTEARALVEEIRQLGRRAWPVEGDLGDPACASDVLQLARGSAGPVDLLVNNASSFVGTRLDMVSAAELHADLDINAIAPFLLAKAFAGQEREGAVVNLLDARITDYDAQHVGYHVSKRVLFALTRMMAVEFAPRVSVNAIAPGLILAPEGKAPSYLADLAHTNPLQRHGDPADVVDAVLFLLCSRFVTGQVIFVDGGRHMRGSMYGC
ncbi:MAG: SDR family oxidoreductase [Nitrospiraceae bacterium]|nr:SDR family oxidoreductase [Nitrospiraceae bacterium]